MSWSFQFTAPSCAAALSHLDTLAESENNETGVTITRPLVEAMSDIDGYGVSITSAGHVADGSFSNINLKISHVQMASESEPPAAPAEE